MQIYPDTDVQEDLSSFVTSLRNMQVNTLQKCIHVIFKNWRSFHDQLNSDQDFQGAQLQPSNSKFNHLFKAFQQELFDNIDPLVSSFRSSKRVAIEDILESASESEEGESIDYIFELKSNLIECVILQFQLQLHSFQFTQCKHELINHMKESLH